MLHTLVAEGRAGMTREQIALACERDPASRRELDETVAALQLLFEDGLATRTEGTVRAEETMHDGEVFKPTRAAIRAAELSF